MKRKSAFSIKKIMQKRSAKFRMDSTQTSFTGQSVFKELTFQGRIPRSLLNKEVRKTYPLRGQFSSAMNDKTCTVVLTRLEDVAGPRVIDGQIGSPPSISCWVDDFGTLKVHTGLPSKRQRICSKGEKIPVVSNEVDPIHNFPEPRQRRLASLNAEAVNNLLFARDAIFSARRVRKDFTKVSGNFNSGEAWQTLKNQEQQVLGKKARQKCIPTNHLQKDVFDNNVKRDDCGVSFPPAPKRLASLNAVAFLKLTNEKANHLKQRSKSDVDSRPANSFSKSKLKSAKSHKKNCIKSQKDVLHSKVDDKSDRPREAEGGFLKPEHQDSSRSLGKIENPNVEQSSNYQDGLDSLYNRLPLLMGGQASMKPEYGRPGEKSPTPKQEFQQPSFPVQQLHHLPVPGSPLDCVGLYNSHNLTLDGNYVSYGQSGLPYNGYPDLSMYTKDGVFSQPVIYEELLISKSSLPSTATLEHLPWCNSRYSLVEDAGTNTDSLCGVIRLPIGRVNNMHTGHNSYPYKKPFTAEGYKTLDQLNIEIATAGHPVSPAHPLSGCPVPSVPPAAEPVPYLQTPNSEPQTLAMVKTARECPQSSKPPSGSKSGVRNTPGCIHVTDDKASKGHSHPKQQRISRRRATNGWMPLGTACEKAVYVVNEPEPALRRSYQAVERNGEIIRVRDTVLLKSGPRKKSMPYVAKISALWEEPITGELMMSLFWYYRPEHTQGGRNPSMHQNEIFASRHQDENSIACIEEKCYVLTFAEYCRFCALVKRRGEGCPNRKALIVPPSEEYCTPIHRRVPDTTDPDLVFLCRHVYDFRHGRILKNPQ